MSEPVRAPRGPLWELTIARIKEAVRDGQALFWTFAFPVLVLIALGVAFRAAPPAHRVADAQVLRDHDVRCGPAPGLRDLGPALVHQLPVVVEPGQGHSGDPAA